MTALAKGNTLRRPVCVHWTGPDPVEWLALQKDQDGTRIISVELADEAIRLGDLPAARCRTIVVLGHERDGIPPGAMELAGTAVEVPVIGWGASVNVAVAGSLVLCRLAGFL
jgi:tRNA (guanosine-2'-O-)-methyltransferase